MPERSNNTVFTFGLTADESEPEEDGLSFPDFVTPKEPEKTDWKQEPAQEPLSEPKENLPEDDETQTDENSEATKADAANEPEKKEDGDQKMEEAAREEQEESLAAESEDASAEESSKDPEKTSADPSLNESSDAQAPEDFGIEPDLSSSEEPEFQKASFLEETDDGQVEVFEEETDTVSVPPVPACMSKSYRGSDLFVFNITQTGESHLKKETGCQDYSGFEIVGDRIVLAAMSDGVGSCEHSDWGARVAVTESLQYLKDCFTRDLEKHDFVFDDVLTMGPLLQETMHRALRKINEKADEFNVLDYALHTTLTIAAYDGDTLYFAHAGDDGIVMFQDDGQYKMVTHRHKGPEASSVFPLQSTTTWQYGKEMHVAGFVMATDGLLDYFVRGGFEDNRVFFPFIRPILYTSIETQEQAETIHHDLEDFLNSPRLREAVTDDLSLIGVVNEKKMKRIPEPEFDIEHWKAMTKEYERRKQKALYPELFEEEETETTDNASSKPEEKNPEPENEVVKASFEEKHPHPSFQPENTTLPDFPTSEPLVPEPMDREAGNNPAADSQYVDKDENTFGDKLLRNVGAAASYLGRKLVKAGQNLEERASRNESNETKETKETKDKPDKES